ncbi:CoA transferase [Vibrio sp. SS-MA-C1-2]|uniref:CaiB/BaiF CoA transferase family protein n=1 Tax=Vibrio sp. SS-MA-C1-2 TaxID=2908646 RepID=UPI001F34CED7|nr:CaiB/BaiF CoA-transferase family protein [Vibrio sp. SS-MA-C1-2]UJF19942.1 CoA transferase [Vibrio sp. SS-MA-C1-2]
MNNKKPLDGVRIIEMSTYVAAPVAAKMLADWGAEVIKIEPKFGDEYRIIGRSLAMPTFDDQNPCFDLENANKKAISIDIRTQEGQEILHKLLKTADGLITNYRNQALEKLHLTYEEIHQKHPSLVYGIVAGYGEKGPDKDKPGYDLTAFLARSGMMIDTVEKGGNPMSIYASFGDHITGTSLAAGMCAGLYKRSKTNIGDKVISGLYQNSLYCFSTMLAATSYGLKYPISHNNSPTPIVNSYQCKDGEWLLLAATNFERQWTQVCKGVLKRPDLAENENYSSIKGMLKNKKEIIDIFDAEFATKDRQEWEVLLIENDIAHEKILHWEDVLNDRQAWENDYLMEVEHKNGTKSVLANTPVSFSSIEKPTFTQAPKIGEHTNEILQSLGYQSEHINQLRANNKIH